MTEEGPGGRAPPAPLAMAGQKRPTVQLAKEVLARAIELRKKGATWRAIGAELGASKSALHQALRDHPDLGDDARGAVAETIEFAERLEDVAEAALVTGRAAIAHVAAKVKSGSATTSDAAGLIAVAERATKLAVVLRGRTRLRAREPEAERTPAEEAALAALATLRSPRPA